MAPGEPARLIRLQSGRVTGLSHRKQTPVLFLIHILIDLIYYVLRIFLTCIGCLARARTRTLLQRIQGYAIGAGIAFCDLCLRFLSSMTSMISFQGGFFMAILPNLKS